MGVSYQILTFSLLAFVCILSGNIGSCSDNKKLCNGQDLYYKPTSRCYLPKAQGPCGDQKLIITSPADPRLGVCSTKAPSKVVSFSISRTAPLACQGGSARDDLGGCEPLANF